MRASIQLSLILSVLFSGLTAHAVGPIEEDRIANEKKLEEAQGWRVEYFNYQDYIYSQSRKTEIGDQVKLDGAFRYQYSPDTFGRFRLQTDPNENRFSNKTSNFELLLGHKVDEFTFQFDGEFNTDDGDNGATSFGADIDSRLTFIGWQFADQWRFTFYPFNFDGEVGNEFNTWDVTRIYYIQGSPSSVSGPPILEESIASKTIPGVELAYGSDEAKVYVGVGAATYEYPADPKFNLETSTSSPRWERREDVGWKFGIISRTPDRQRTELKYVGHNKSNETGSLLAEAASVYTLQQFSAITLEAEVTYSKAGDQAYRLTKDGTWFETTAPTFEPVYADHDGNRQDWLGKGDFATSLRLGFRRENSTPYISYKYQGEYFIYRERESAHRLRTYDEKSSHGGLNRVGVGTFIYKGDFVINPELEWMKARNEVFGNSTDVRSDRFNSTFDTEDFVLFLTLSYQFGGNKAFRP